MPSPAYEQILRVQGHDLNLRQLSHRHQHHPIRSDLAELESQIAAVDDELAAIDERHHDVERQRKRLEDEASTMKAKRDDIDGKLYGGEVTASKELLALQDEAAMLLGKQNELEEGELELMETLESIGAEQDEASGRRTAFDQQRSDAESALTVALAEIKAEVESVKQQRTESLVGADEALLSRYEALRDQYDGVAVAQLVNRTCDGCHIQLSAVALDQIVKMPEDAVVTCEECGRLLVH